MSSRKEYSRKEKRKYNACITTAVCSELWSFPAEKERELGNAYSEIKGLKVTEALKDKAIAEV